MKPAFISLTIIAGQTLDDSFVFENAEGVREDFSGYEARMQIRETIDSPTVVLELTTGNGMIEALDDTGTIRFAVSPATTSAVSTSHDYETLCYDLEIFTAGDADVKRLMQGTVTVWPETTR